MRVLICGSRNWDDYEAIAGFIDTLPPDSVVIEGEARGADSMARDAAWRCGLTVERYPADWGRYGRAAGAIRNAKMLRDGKPDLVVFFSRDLAKSRGTANMVEQARKAGIPVEIGAQVADACALD